MPRCAPVREFVSIGQCSALAPPPAAGDGRLVELGLRARVTFAASYLSLQAALVVTSPRRPDHAFGFQMFNESSTVHFSLLREVEAPSGHGTLIVHAYDGEWTAKGADGKPHRFYFRDRVKVAALSTFDVTLEAGYGAAAQLARMQAALDDVAEHTPNDVETQRLLADVTVKRNGREPVLVRLTSAPRLPSSPP